MDNKAKYEQYKLYIEIAAVSLSLIAGIIVIIFKVKGKIESWISAFLIWAICGTVISVIAASVTLVLFTSFIKNENIITS